MSKREFHYKDNKSDKFWIIELQGNKHTVHFGRTGTNGQTQTKSFPSPDKAEASYKKLIKEKLGKGYIEVSGGTREDTGKFRCPSSFQARKDYFLSALENSDPKFRMKGASYLGEKKYLLPDVLNKLTEVIKDKESFVRYAAARTIGILCEKDNISGLFDGKIDFLIELPGIDRNKIEKVITALREAAKDEVPYVRIMAEEALRKTGHKETILEITKRAMLVFPADLREKLEKDDEKFLSQFREYFPGKPKVHLLEALYEIDNKIARKSLFEILSEVDIRKYWNNIKSIYKRAEYRMDLEMVGLLAFRIESSPPGKQEYEYGSWFEVNDITGKNVSLLKEFSSRGELIESIPGNRLMSSEELTQILDELGCSEDEIKLIKKYTLYYGFSYRADEEFIENLKNTVTAGMLDLFRGRMAGPVSGNGLNVIFNELNIPQTNRQLITKFTSQENAYGKYFEINEWSPNTMSYYVPKAKVPVIHTLPKHKLMTKDEYTAILKGAGFEDKEITSLMGVTGSYGQVYKMDDDIINDIKKILEGNKLELIKEKCNKIMSVNEFTLLLNEINLEQKEKELILKILSSYTQHTSFSHKKFAGPTKIYLRRRIWRYFKNIAKKYPHLYGEFAYHFLKNFKDSHASPMESNTISRYDWSKRQYYTKTTYYGRFNHLWAFNHILFRNSKRYVYKNIFWRCVEGYVPSELEPEEREEAFPELWEKNSTFLTKLFLESECREVCSFALKVLKEKFPEVLINILTVENLKRLLDKPFTFVKDTVLKILDEKILPERFDINLIKLLLNNDFSPAREMARKWIGKIIHSGEEKRALLNLLFASPYGDNWPFALGLISELSAVNPSLKEEYFEFLMKFLQKDGKEEAFYNILIKTLKDSFPKKLLSLGGDKILSLLNSSVRIVADLGGWLLQNCDLDPFEIDKSVIIGFANHEVVSVREAGRKFMKAAGDRWKEELYLLLPLLESLWEDTREFAFQFLTEKFTPEDFTPSMLLDLYDSNEKAVQDFGKKMLEDYILRGEDLDFMKFTEHPHRNVWEFALNIVTEKLPCEIEKIKSVMPFLRRILFTVNKGRKLKNKALIYLERISLEDAFMAAEVSDLLEDYCHNITGKDFSFCLVIMTKIKNKYPYVKCPVELIS